MNNQQTPAVLLEVNQVSKHFKEGNIDTQVLHDVNLEIVAGELVAIIGSSGSGKSTLLHIMGTLDKPSSGQVKMLVRPLSVNDRETGERAQSRLRVYLSISPSVA